MSMDLATRRFAGIAFQIVAAALSNRRSLYVFVRVAGTCRRNADTERKDSASFYGVTSSLRYNF